MTDKTVPPGLFVRFIFIIITLSIIIGLIGSIATKWDLIYVKKNPSDKNSEYVQITSKGIDHSYVRATQILYSILGIAGTALLILLLMTGYNYKRMYSSYENCFRLD